MADLTDLQAAITTKVVGASSAGIEDNYMEVDSSGRITSKLNDGSGNSLTSTLINSKQRLDINTASEGVDGGALPFQTLQVGGTDGTNLQTISTDTLGRLKLAASSFYHPIFTLRVQAVTGNTGSATTSLVIPIASTSSGNFMAVMVSSSTAATITVTDNLSQVYSTAISGTSGTHTNYTFYKANTSAGVTSITISSNINSGLVAVVTEYFGISTSPLDKTATATVTGVAAFSSGSTAATTSAVELLLGSAHGVAKNNQTYTPGTNWNSVGTSNGFNAGAGQLYVEDQYTSVVGTYAATGTASGNDTIISNIATFIVTDTNLSVINQPKVVKSGSGVLRRIIVNTIGTGSPTVTLYDNTTNSGTVIGVLSLSTAGSLDYNLNFTNGLTIVASSTTGDFTVVYD